MEKKYTKSGKRVVFELVIGAIVGISVGAWLIHLGNKPSRYVVAYEVNMDRNLVHGNLTISTSKLTEKSLQWVREWVTNDLKTTENVILLSVTKMED